MAPASIAAYATSLAGVVDATLVSGVIVPYLPQILEIRRGDSAFNPTASLILIVSATLRLAFWFAKPFDPVLAVQAAASIATQFFVMAAVCSAAAAHRRAPAGTASRVSSAASPSFFDFEPRSFWKWPRLSSYLQFETTLVVLLVLLHGTFGGVKGYGDLLGALSLGIEALLPIPQALQNARHRSSAGLTLPLIAAWFCGDAFKTGVALYRGLPLQFVVCGCIQLSVDTIIVLQTLVWYPAGAAAAAAAMQAPTTGHSVKF